MDYCRLTARQCRAQRRVVGKGQSRINRLVSLRGMAAGTPIQNTVSLYAIQFVNYIFPLVTIPYLVRALGPTNYGALAFAQSLIGYFLVLTDYGFDLTATRKIAVNRNDPLALSRIAVSTWAAKFLLCGCGFVVLLLVSMAVPKVGQSRTLAIVLYGSVLGNALFPTWLFQGMERMVLLSLINVPVRFLTLAAMFVVVREPADYLAYGWLLSASSVLTGALGLRLALTTFGLRLVKPSAGDVRDSLRSGWLVFLATAAGNIYVAGNSFLLGLFRDHAAVGYYSAAERLVRGVVAILEPVVRATYPTAARIAAESRGEALVRARRLLVYMSAAGLGLSLTLAAVAPFVSSLALGPGYEESTQIIRILSPLPLLIAISYVLGPQLLLPLKMDKSFALILILAATLDVGIGAVFAALWGGSGMAVALLLTELFVSGALIVSARRGARPGEETEVPRRELVI